MFNFSTLLKGKKIGFGVLIAVLAVGILWAVFSAGVLIGKNQVVCEVCKPEKVNFSLFWDAYAKLHEHFINPDTIVDQKVLYGAIEGMTKSVGDPYTSFFDPAQAKTFQEDLAGSFDGIGIEVGLKKGQMTVIAPLKGTPSDKVGLKAGDQIIKINDKSTYDMTIEQAVNIIRGKKGQSVKLTIFREGWSDTKDFNITRDTIKVPSVEWELKDGTVAYIQMHQFDQTLSADFRKMAFEIVKSPAKSLVLDLRNNPGGYLQVSQEVAGFFLERNQIVTLEDFGQDKAQQEYRTDGNAMFASYPMVVLINQGSASASEILAGALRDNRNIKLIGEKSFGKGSVQEVIKLQDGASFLKITVAKWLTPKGASISEVGLTPDVKVEANTDANAPDKDPQLEKALEIIKGMK